jgi:hypothetical protein
MTLKKSDKIIAIVGVVILIIAGIGIFLYVSPEKEDDDDNGKPLDEMFMYEVKTDEVTNGMGEESFSFRKGLLLITKDTLSNSEFVSFPVDNLKSVEFNISYNDNRVGGIGGILFSRIFTLGKDKLDVTITDPDGGTQTVRVDGNEKIIFDGINPKINIGSIDALTESKALDLLEDEYESKWKDQTFSIDAELKVGFVEIFRPFLRLMERLRGDSFTVEITYTYYDYDLEEVSEPGEEEPPTGMDPSGGYLGKMVSMGQGRW